MRPAILWCRLSLALPIEDYAGKYWSKAYGEVNFSVRQKDGEDKIKVLYALADNQTWVTELYLEHVNAELWLGERHTPDSPVRSSFRAESKVGSNGNVESIGLVMEDSMPNTLIWFERKGGMI